MEPASYSQQAVLRGALILCFSLSVFGQTAPQPEVNVVPSIRRLPDLSLTVLPPTRNSQPVFEFRGIRIGDEMRDAERKFLSFKAPSLSSKPGLCGSDGIKRIETCTDVLNSGEYVDVTMLDRKVAQIYVSMDGHKKEEAYNSYVAALRTKYGRPDIFETKYYHEGGETGSSGKHLRWLDGDQYMEGSESERAVTIGSRSLDSTIDELERVDDRN
jgi:hypothetical protein